MDLLADILEQAGLQKRILNQRALPRGIALKFPCEKSIGFHVVLQGQVFVLPPGHSEAIALRKGDAVLMARGCHHLVSTEADFSKAKVTEMGQSWGDEPGVATVISGAYQFWNPPLHPFFEDVPDWFVVRSEELGALEEFSLVMGLLSRESGSPGLGSETVVHALLDVVFTYLMRKLVTVHGDKPQSWSRALREPAIRRALELMHGDCGRDWSLEELARQAGVSRAGLAQKFRDAMGTTPLHYLRTLRMQKAIGLLTRSTDSLEKIAEAVGYQDAFGFSKVFKKTVGVSPRDFRARDRAQRADPWRF